MTPVVIIKWGALGDLILAAATIQALHTAHAGETVEVITAPAFAGLVSDWGCRVRAVPRGSGRALLAAAWALRRAGCRRVYDLQGNQRSRVLSLLSGAPERFGLWLGWPYTQAASVPREQKIHPQQRLNTLLTAAGLPPAPQRFPFAPGAAAQARVAQWLAERALTGQPLALLHAGGSARWQSKRWPEASFLTLAHTLTAAGYAVIWVGGPDERALNARLAAAVGQDAGGAFTLAELLALATRARLAVTNDSGPMHTLAAGNIPVYALFGPTRWQTSHALGQAQRVLTANVACSPCFQPHCPLTAAPLRCLTEITPEQVLARLRTDGLLT